MWFGILTPGAHPSRRTATTEATVFCWSRDDRRRIDGPFAMVHGGLRVTRRLFHDQGLADCPPRCFVCREPCVVPRVDDLRVRADILEAPSFSPEGASPPDGAFLAWAHLADLEGPLDTPLDEETVLVVPHLPLAVRVPLECVPVALGFMARTVADAPPARCEGCGLRLPGSDAQRATHEARAARRPAARCRSHGRRAA